MATHSTLTRPSLAAPAQCSSAFCLSTGTLLTSVLLMQTIDRHQFEAETILTLDSLVELDYQRANYYKDLREYLS